MSPAVTSPSPGSRGDATSATDPNSFYTSSTTSIQISYGTGDGHSTTQDLQAFRGPQFSAEVEHVVNYPMASADLFQQRERVGNQTSLNGKNNSISANYHQFAKAADNFISEKESQIGVSLKVVTLMPDKDNSNGFRTEEGANANKPETSPHVNSDKFPAEMSQQRQDSGIFEDASTFYEDSSTDDLEVHCSGSVTSDLEADLQSSDSDLDRGTDSATSDLEKELIPITQKLERVSRPQDTQDVEFSPTTFDFERSAAPEAEVIAVAAAACIEQEAFDEFYSDRSPPPTPMASESDIEGFASPPPTPNYEPPPTPTYEAAIIEEVQCNSPVPMDTTFEPAKPREIQCKIPTPCTRETTEAEVQRENLFPLQIPLEDPQREDLPLVHVQAPLPLEELQHDKLVEEQCNEPTPLPPLTTPPPPAPSVDPVPAYEDIPPVLTSIYEESRARNADILNGLTEDPSEYAYSDFRRTDADGESPPVLICEAPWRTTPIATSERPMPKSRRGTRKFITPRNFTITPHSSAEIQERVKNRHRNSVVSYSSSPSSPVVSEPGILRTDYFSSIDTEISPVYSTEQQYTKRKTGRQSETKCSKSKPKARGRKRKTSDERRAPVVKKPKSDKGLFIVEKILRKTVVAGIPYFLVKWLNYPDSNNTWEPYENFSAELITAYENSLVETKPKPKEVEVPAKKVPIPPLIRRRSTTGRSKCAGCASYPTTFTDQRMGPTGFDRGYTYINTRESFVLDGVKCGLVEFDEKRILELIPFSIINEKIKAQLVNI